MSKAMSDIDNRFLLLLLRNIIKRTKRSPVRFRKDSLNKCKKIYKIYLIETILEKDKRTRRFWVRDALSVDQRIKYGASNNLVVEMQERDPEKFINFFRMTPAVFSKLLHIVGPKIIKRNFIRESISPDIRLQITLRYLASGDSMASLGYLFRVGPNTVSKIISDTCQVIWNELKDQVFFTPSENNWIKIANEFDQKWNFKNCIGAIDGKHIVIQALPNSGSRCYNYKGAHSLVLLAVVDASYKFILVDVGAEGRQSESGIFKSSIMGQGFENKLLCVPSPRDQLPFVLVGDEAFQLTEYMMRPYSRKGPLDMQKKVFNYRLSRARRVVENSFGLLAARWRIFRKPIIASESTVKRIILASVCLHNYILIKDPSQLENSDRLGNSGNIGEVELSGFLNVRRAGTNTFSRNAANIRDRFTDFFCTAGAVDWQWEKALNNSF